MNQTQNPAPVKFERRGQLLLKTLMYQRWGKKGIYAPEVENFGFFVAQKRQKLTEKLKTKKKKFFQLHLHQ